MASIVDKIRGFLHLPTQKHELLAFIGKIRPFTTNHELVRIGGQVDGGYLVPNDLVGIRACFSPGVNNTSDFEVGMAELGIPSFMADYSVDGPPVKHPLFDFEKKFLGAKNDRRYMTLEDWVKRKAPKEGDMILQMDIEGGEYPTLAAAPLEILRRFRIIVIEFHRLRRLRDKAYFEKIAAAFNKLSQDFVVAHIHPNNESEMAIHRGIQIPRVMEFTFLRKDRVASCFPTTAFPHALDRANTSFKPDMILPDCWFKFDD